MWVHHRRRKAAGWGQARRSMSKQVSALGYWKWTTQGSGFGIGAKNIMCNIATILGGSDIIYVFVSFPHYSSVRITSSTTHRIPKVIHTRISLGSGTETYLQSFSVEGDGLFYVSLFSLDVGQVVQGVCMVGVHVQSSVVALLSLCHLVTKVEYITAPLCHRKYITSSCYLNHWSERCSK